jgi:hypothetical protein
VAFKRLVSPFSCNFDVSVLTNDCSFLQASSSGKWALIGGQIGFPHFQPAPGEMPLAAPQVAEQLAKIYERLLYRFEMHWYASLRPHDPQAPIPLPPNLQHLHARLQAMVNAQGKVGLAGGGQSSPQIQQANQPNGVNQAPSQAQLHAFQHQPPVDVGLSQAERILTMTPDELRRLGYGDDKVRDIL